MSGSAGVMSSQAAKPANPAPAFCISPIAAAGTSLARKCPSRSTKLIRKYCENAQYIVISHNDAIISEADNLYGVSMNEHSVSNVVALKI